MDNDLKNCFIIDKKIIGSFFKEFIEETRQSNEMKSQLILSLLNSIKEDAEQKVSKSK
jgi:hypothetical protein